MAGCPECLHCRHCAPRHNKLRPDSDTFEAMHAVIAHAAIVLRLRRLETRTQIGNVRAIRLLERLGFKREGLMRGYVERDGERRDCLLFGLLL